MDGLTVKTLLGYKNKLKHVLYTCNTENCTMQLSAQITLEINHHNFFSYKFTCLIKLNGGKILWTYKYICTAKNLYWSLHLTDHCTWLYFTYSIQVCLKLWALHRLVTQKKLWEQISFEFLWNRISFDTDTSSQMGAHSTLLYSCLIWFMESYSLQQCGKSFHSKKHHVQMWPFQDTTPHHTSQLH